MRVLNGGNADVISALAEIPVPGANFETVKVDRVRPGCKRWKPACGCLVAKHIRLLLCVAPDDAPRSFQLVYPDDEDPEMGNTSIRWVNIIVGTGLGARSAPRHHPLLEPPLRRRPFRAVGGTPCGPDTTADPVEPPPDPGTVIGGGGPVKPSSRTRSCASG